MKMVTIVGIILVFAGITTYLCGVVVDLSNENESTITKVENEIFGTYGMNLIRFSGIVLVLVGGIVLASFSPLFRI